MMRSMYSAISGLRSHQTKMDVIGNNIANVNTVDIKADGYIPRSFSQVIRGLVPQKLARRYKPSTNWIRC